MPREVLHCDMPRGVTPVWSPKEEHHVSFPQEAMLLHDVLQPLNCPWGRGADLVPSSPRGGRRELEGIYPPFSSTLAEG